MDQSGKGQKVVLGLDEKENWARVHFTAGPGVFKGSPGTPFPAESETALIRALGAEIEVDEAKGEVILSLPSSTATP
jgi:hypothetical protein